MEQIDLAPQIGEGFEALQSRGGIQDSRIQGVKCEAEVKAKVEAEVKVERDTDCSTSSFSCAILSLRLMWIGNLRPS